MPNPVPAAVLGLPIAAIDLLDEAFLFCDLLHMAMKSLSVSERDALHSGIDQVSERILTVKRIIKEGAA
ncbi:hypothetical protein O4J55_25385, partial [Paracoccus sp. PXZ]